MLAVVTPKDFGTSRLATPIEPYTFFGSLWKGAATFPVMAPSARLASHRRWHGRVGDGQRAGTGKVDITTDHGAGFQRRVSTTVE
jgi:hypothetical protein